jgi:hypothetical protein
LFPTILRPLSLKLLPFRSWLYGGNGYDDDDDELEEEDDDDEIRGLLNNINNPPPWMSLFSIG